MEKSAVYHQRRVAESQIKNNCYLIGETKFQ